MQGRGRGEVLKIVLDVAVCAFRWDEQFADTIISQKARIAHQLDKKIFRIMDLHFPIH